MAVTFGQMTARILRETSRDDTFIESVQDSIVTAIKELEIEQYWLFEKSASLTLFANTNSVILPLDFVSLSGIRILINGIYYAQGRGFNNVTSEEIFRFTIQDTSGIPYIWAIFNNQIYVHPYSIDDYTIEIFYFQKDPVYPVNYTDSSIWLGDMTEDLTRYKALAIFYRDTLQSEEKGQFYESKAIDIINNRRRNNNQRQVINKLSI
jgi:hypothetical protein